MTRRPSPLQDLHVRGTLRMHLEKSLALGVHLRRTARTLYDSHGPEPDYAFASFVRYRSLKSILISKEACSAYRQPIANLIEPRPNYRITTSISTGR